MNSFKRHHAEVSRDPASATDDGLHALFVLSGLKTGGSENKAVRVSSALAKRELAIGVACLQEEIPARADLHERVALWPLPRRGRFSMRALAALVRIMRRQRPAAAVAMNLYPLLYVFLARRLAGLERTRCVALINTSTFIRRRDRPFMLIYAPILRRADTVVFGCESQRRDWIRRYRLPERRACVVYNGVDAQVFSRDTSGLVRASARRAAGIDDTQIVIGSVGRLAPEKNHLALLGALPGLIERGIDAVVMLVGDGPMRSVLREKANALGVADRCKLLGELPDVRPALLAMDIFALPSVAVETFSNAVLEAMAMELPVVISEIGGASEMVCSGVEGYIVRPSDPVGLVEALASLCQDAAARARMGTAARARVVAQFTFDRMVERYAELVLRGGHGD